MFKRSSLNQDISGWDVSKGIVFVSYDAGVKSIADVWLL
jgi:hypothetical protein